ncbi:hypothetical protein TGPRC2_222948 [Toxoplasma gondii TgCatPRC2]|uniref:Uncharacterized protein n=14 Tax=Toxoplasma gondii TaxID=5811 RepID=A0A125YPE1_TOXGV|nr:hypothetical protein TGME49_222948 [Toxoplasma gondii ME49]EPR58443.1 hypothetical protein TGGT1_222948 [Toxoplasma gondii GT1]ESS30001.1 hypothetical protein TGVEG_222948 [Toxoplasma gondii VEG]KAF4645678.1 hypothetical protein TGRH88_001640 [Toxoplasma gondii]KFG35974.1 hypothetical protein TGP89_222948 [Toxoplasma gondii p89]KFG41761.1 hypothetical protein TGDOM2_222948 [Toxoplasma gondii GAB2-2007-GAL-DOM2]KFG47938.1 hypothetical protein TGFOU_222948 [Toxoplasma gondii FOU]KFG61216.1 |eukprot:XP_018638328.1 hypothetical protein TGME49_222948 [Toxoplasma gondii ME49]
MTGFSVYGTVRSTLQRGTRARKQYWMVVSIAARVNCVTRGMTMFFLRGEAVFVGGRVVLHDFVNSRDAEHLSSMSAGGYICFLCGPVQGHVEASWFLKRLGKKAHYYVPGRTCSGVQRYSVCRK